MSEERGLYICITDKDGLKLSNQSIIRRMDLYAGTLQNFFFLKKGSKFSEPGSPLHVYAIRAKVDICFPGH